MFWVSEIMSIQIMAVASSVCGTWALKTAWRSSQRSWPLVLTAWGLIFTSFSLWALTTAMDKGVALGVTTWMVVVLVFLLSAAIKSPMRVERVTRKRPNKIGNNDRKGFGKSRVVHRALTAVMIGPIAGLICMAASTLILLVLQAMHLEYTANLSAVSMLFPVMWGALAVTLGYQQSIKTRLMTVSGIAAACILGLWITS